MLHVTCEATLTKVADKAAAAQRDGFHVRVTDTSGMSGTYLNYSYEPRHGSAQGGGEPVPASTTSLVLPVPPGKVSLECSHDLGTTQTPAVTVDLEDPGEHFARTTLRDLGCDLTGSVSWAHEGRGDTPDAAVEALLAQSADLHDARPRLAPVGYADAVTMIYLIDRAGRPWAAATVARSQGESVAHMSHLC